MRTLWAHQEKARSIARARALEGHGGLFILFDLGTGKTGTAISILRDRFNESKEFIPTLIFAPISILDQWKKEFGNFSKVDPSRIFVLKGSGKKRLDTLRAARQTFSDRIIVIANYESLRTESVSAEFRAWGPRILVLDESQRVKNPSSVTFKQMRPIADKAEYSYLMTGTPILKNPMDLFAQFRLLDGGSAFGDNFFVFRQRYFYDANAHLPKHVHFPKWEIRENSLAMFNRVLAEYSIKAKKEECLDLPPLIESRVPVEMSPQQATEYQRMKKDFIAFIKEKQGEGIPEQVVANFAVTKAIRLQQIVCGFLETPDAKKPIFFDDCPRLDALREKLIEIKESGEKCILWTDFVATYDKLRSIAEEVGFRVALLTGSQSQREKEASIAAFKGDGADLLLSNPKAGGTGLDLYMAKYAIFYSRPYAAGDYWQAIGRNYRGGSDMHERVVHYHLYSPGTIDEAVLQNLQAKQDVVKAILDFASVSEKDIDIP